MERTDDVEHVFLKGIGDGLVFKAGIVVVKHAFFARARRTYVAARVAADAARELAAPECVALLRRHRLELCDLVKAAAVRILLTLFAEQLVEADDLFALAGPALEQQRVGFPDGLVAVDGGELQLFAVFRDGGHTGGAQGLDGLHVAHAVALHADGIDILTQDAVLLQKLDEGIAVARLEEHGGLAALARFRDQVFGQIRAREDAPDEVLLHILRARERRGGQIVEELARAPADDAVNGLIL